MDYLFLKETFTNKPLAAALLAWFIAQSIKIVRHHIKNGEVDFRLFLSTGGLFSAHCAAVSALAVSIGKIFGWGSGLFAVATVFASVVISDAQGIRKATGKQAEILNQIIEDLYQKKELKITRVKELLGHTAREVFFGIILGILVGILF